MKTRIIKIDGNHIKDEDLKLPAKVLQEGGLVAFPTETVYGIGANALNSHAIEKIYQAKGRPSDNPLIIHISSKAAVNQYVKEVPDIAIKLMDQFWPGPLTLILKKNDIIPDAITGGLDTVAIRMPSDKIANALIRLSNLPIAAPSANISGKPSPTLAKHVIEDLNGRVDVIIDGGQSPIGLESTVVDLSAGQPIILRPGGITQTMLEEVVGSVLVDQTIMNDSKAVPKAPGMKYRHYAPNGQLYIIRGNEKDVIKEINWQVKDKEEQGYKVAVITTRESRQLYNCKYIQIIGANNNQNEIAANLFKILREMDEQKVDYIYSEEFSKSDIGLATMNRLLKAAGNNIINVSE
jgi:L-threonylcarbamoyladenylate synthase